MSDIKKVIISGASGQDGSYMAEYLLKNTENTIIVALRRTSQPILANLSHVLGNPRVKVVTLDLCDGEAIRRLIREERPDYFINLAAQTFVADSWMHPVVHMQTNAMSLIHILEAVKEYVPKCRVYSAGSSEEFGDVKYSPQDEKHPMSPRSVYGVSKCAAHHICKVYRESYGIYVVHGILFNHESERRQEYFVSRKISLGVARIYHALRLHQSFESIELGNVDSKRDWSHAEDFIDGIWKMLNQDVEKPWEYVLASNETHSVREFVGLAFNEAGIDGDWIKNDNPEKEVFVRTIMYPNGVKVGMGCLVRINPKFYRPAEVELLHGDSTRARKELGWTPKISFPELVQRMVKSDIELHRLKY